MLGLNVPSTSGRPCVGPTPAHLGSQPSTAPRCLMASGGRLMPFRGNLARWQPLTPRLARQHRRQLSVVQAAPGESTLQQVKPALQRFWEFYNRSLAESPVQTKAMTSFTGFVLGDILAQVISGQMVDPTRVARLGVYGLLLDGPIGHMWYRILDATVFPREPTSNKAVVAKTTLDQIVWAPLMTCVFFAVLRTLEGHPGQILSTIDEKLLKTFLANLCVWPLAHLINFKFVPSEQRILYNNTVSVAWTVWLSLLAHSININTESLTSLIDQTQLLTSLLQEQAMPPSFQTQLQQALQSATGLGLPGMQ